MFSLVTNITQLGDITPEIPLPVPHSLLAPAVLSHYPTNYSVNPPQAPLINHITQMLQDSNIEYIKLKPNTTQLPYAVSTLLQSKPFSSLNNILAQQRAPSYPVVSGLPIVRVDIHPIPKSKPKGKEKSTPTIPATQASPRKGKNARAKQRKEEVMDIDLEKCFGCADLNNFAELIDDLFSATDVVDVGKENVASSSQNHGIVSEHGVVSHEFLSKLRTEIALVSKSSTSSLSKVPADVLSRLMSVMEQLVLQSATISLTKSTTSDCYSTILASLEASLVILSLLLIADMPKSIFSEEVIENMLATVKFQLFANVLAHHDPSFKVYSKNEKQEDGDSEKEDEMLDKPKSKKESRQQKTLVDEVKHISGYVGDILDKFHSLASKFVFTDAVVLQLTNVTLPVFFVEGVNSLQLGALNVVRAIFAKYPPHRALILEEVFENLAKLPKTKRNLRTYRLPQENKSIQMVSALVMQLIQSCTALPSNTEGQDESSFGAALICAKTFLSSFMKRCSNKSQEDDYRPILENFTTDILTTLNMPEWPAAEILLQILNSNLVGNIAKKVDPANILRMLSIELLGTIGAKLRTEINSCEETNPLPAAMTDTASVEEDARCICNKGDFGSFMLDCDDCHKWFHGDCVGIEASNPPKIWYCDACQIKRQVGSHKKQTGKTNEKDDAASNSNDVMKQIYLNYLTTRARVDPSSSFARQFCLSQWCHYDQGKGEEVIEYYKSQWDLPPKTANNTEVTVTREGVLKIGRSLALQRGQHKAFNAVLNHLLSVLAEPQKSCRAKAMRALTTIVEADSNILGDTRVQNSVKNRFLDESPAVRESTIDLVGRFVLSKPDLMSTYYEKIVDRISDKAVSVRKRVVKLLRDICFQQPNNRFINGICKALVGRINDEESIKELVIKVFQEMWFSNKILDDSKSTKVSLGIQVSQIMDVVNLIENDDWLVDLLEKLLKDKDKKQLGVCSKLCECLLETILSAEDKKAVNAVSSKTAVVLAVKGLHTFCKAYPPLLISHAPTLATYLQVTDRANKEESAIALHVAKILEKTIPFMDHPDPGFLLQVESDLVLLIQTQGTPVVQSCMECLCEMVNKVTKKSTKLEDLMRKYYPLLEAMKSQPPKTDMKSVVATVRSIFATSLLCKYFDFEPTGIAMEAEAKKGSKMLLAQGHVVDTVLNTYLELIKHKDLEIGVRILQGIGCLCLRKPQLLMTPKVKTVIEMALTDQSPRRKEAMLKMLAELLEGEDAKAKQAATKTDKSTDENPGFGLVGSTMQVHLDKILVLLLDKDERVRAAALTTTHRIVAHRLVIPIECVPYLMALEGDQVSAIADSAHKLLLLINEKHPNFLLNRIVEGVKRLFSFRKELFGGEADTRCGTSAVVKIYGIIKSTRTNRNAFLSSLVKTLEYTRSDEADASLSRFICEIAAFLPYTTADEPIVIVQTIDKIVSLKGSALLTSLKSVTSSPVVLASSTSSTSSSTATANLKSDCAAANSIIFLLELKRFLISRYSLSARYKNLTPNETIKGPLTDKLVGSDECATFPDVHPFSPIVLFSASAAKELCDKLKTIMKQDESEYFPLVSSSSPTKPKRKNASAPKKRKQAGDSKPKRKQKKLKMDSDDDDGMGDDEYIPGNS